jgi:predicted amidohydrolase
MATLGLGLAQLECAPLDVSENVARTSDAIAKAAADGAELVVLPELAACGYVLDADALRPLAESPHSPGPALSAWSECAARHRVSVVGGFCEAAGGRLYNSAIVIGPDGSVAGLYRKLHVFGIERDVFAPGDCGLPIIDLGGLRLGVLICYDLRFPEAMRILALRGADLIAVPTAWVIGFDAEPPDPATTRIGQVDAALVQANLNGVFVGCADQVGHTDAHSFLGRSLAADPFGRVLIGPLDPCRAEVAEPRVDLDSRDAAADRGGGIRPLHDRRTDVYDETLGYREPDPLAIPA